MPLDDLIGIVAEQGLEAAAEVASERNPTRKWKPMTKGVVFLLGVVLLFALIGLISLTV